MRGKSTSKRESNIPEGFVGVAGMIRVNIVNPDGTVAGDSGWKKNVITTKGLTDYIIGRLVGASGSNTPTYFALGEGNTSMASNASSLPSQIGTMTSVTTAHTARGASSDANTLQFTATFASNAFAGTKSLGCAGLHHTNTPGSVMCGATFTQSTLATNQAVNCTYNLLFAATVTNN